ncbi:hypothetical protein ACFL6C_12815, partial [Myxococcota bacterium]
ERKKNREAMQAEREKFEEQVQRHVDDHVNAEVELARVKHELDQERELIAELRGDAALTESNLLERIEDLEGELQMARRRVTQKSEDQRAAARDFQKELEVRDASIQNLKALLDEERLKVAQRDEELLQKEERTTEVPRHIAPSRLDEDEKTKLGRAIGFALKVLASELGNAIAPEQREELMKRARIALSVARNLARRI